MEPITRREMFMAKAGGQDVNTPTPITREEMFLSQIGGGDSNIILAKFTEKKQGDSLAVRCLNYSPDEIIHYLNNGKAVLANVYIGQGEIKTAVCWMDTGGLYVGDWGIFSGWHFDEDDGELWYEF